MVNCSVVGCIINRSSNYLPGEISFHKIPSASDKNKQPRALTNIRRDNSLPKDSFCSQHFKPSCFQSSKLIIFTFNSYYYVHTSAIILKLRYLHKLATSVAQLFSVNQIINQIFFLYFDYIMDF